jgi:beta-glucanase (GH16 family)
MEVFGDAVQKGASIAMGCGLHAFRDPGVTEDFDTVRLPIDLSDFHTYGVRWSKDTTDFFVDGEPVRSCAWPPAYPMQMMLAVFDFPEQSTGGDNDAVPEMIVDYVRGYRPG